MDEYRWEAHLQDLLRVASGDDQAVLQIDDLPGGQDGFTVLTAEFSNPSHPFVTIRRSLEGAAHDGEFLLWGEWEPPSKVEESKASGPSYPQYLHRPFLEPRTEFAGHQNTDPFVFGDEFLYTGCQQWRGKPHGNPVQLRYLLPGSLILFGSCAGDRFLLDTVFVVRRLEGHRDSCLCRDR